MSRKERERERKSDAARPPEGHSSNRNSFPLLSRGRRSIRDEKSNPWAAFPRAVRQGSTENSVIFPPAQQPRPPEGRVFGD